MLLVSSCVPVITWLCSRVMRFQSRPTNWPLLTIESPVAQVVRASDQITEGRGFKSHLGLGFFFRVLLKINIMFIIIIIIIISFVIPKYNNLIYNYNYYHQAYTYKRTTNLSTHAIPQSPHKVCLMLYNKCYSKKDETNHFCKRKLTRLQSPFVH